MGVQAQAEDKTSILSMNHQKQLNVSQQLEDINRKRQDSDRKLVKAITLRLEHADHIFEKKESKMASQGKEHGQA